jgi:hypothetical protein
MLKRAYADVSDPAGQNQHYDYGLAAELVPTLLVIDLQIHVENKISLALLASIG